MIVPIVISLIASSGSTIVQVLFWFKKKVLLRRFLAAVFLSTPWVYSLIDGGSNHITLTMFPAPDLLIPGIFFSLLAILINYRFAGRADNIKIYPQIRNKIWTPGLFFLNLLSWSVYLVAYEFLFREYLLLSCLTYGSVGFAIKINTVLYALAHLHKGPKETILSIPFGILLCLITLQTGTFWNAVLIHISLAVSNDYFALKASAPHASVFSSKNFSS